MDDLELPSPEHGGRVESDEFRSIAVAARKRTADRKAIVRRYAPSGQVEGPQPSSTQIFEPLETDILQSSKSSSLDSLNGLPNQANEELILDTSRLPHGKIRTLNKPVVTSSHFSPEVRAKTQYHPDVIEDSKESCDTKRDCLADRLSLVVMSARVTASSRSETAQITPEPVSSALIDNYDALDSNRAPDEGELPPPPPPPRTERQTNVPPRTYSVDSVAQTWPPSILVGRRLVFNSPVQPNPSPALSNDAGETLGNLTELTERLNIVRNGIDEAGIVPQSRFASPVAWGGVARRGSSLVESWVDTAAAGEDVDMGGDHGTLGSRARSTSQLAHPQPTRGPGYRHAVLDSPSPRTASTGRPALSNRSSYRPSPLSGLQIVEWEVTEVASDDENCDERGALDNRKRRSSETDTQNEQFLKKIRSRYDSIWNRNTFESRKGSGAGGSLSG
ncbi:hypothetical protein HBI20_234030 [Parastagonospora nodorum]|nr:hypothetical protein HBI20_234030 [Parastagonospora nodorum]